MESPSRRPGRYERLARERHERDLALSLQPGGHPKGFWYDEAAGQWVVDWIEKFCRHEKGEWAGQPLVLSEFQRLQIRVAFGWKRADGTRRFRILYSEEPRKNGKSTRAAALGLYLLVGDKEPGAEVYSSATKKDQARIVWSAAAAMLRKSPELRKYVRAYRNNLHCERLASKFEPLGADSTTLDGLNPHGNIVDELHAHKDRGVWDVLDTAMGARREPMTIAITTAGTYDPDSIGWQTHDYAVKVLEGVIEDDAFFAFIASADEGDDTQRILKERPDYYLSEDAQRTANPNFGVSVKPEYLSTQAAKAVSQPSFYNEYLRLHLNVWTQQVERWLSLQKWAASDPSGTDRAQAVAKEEALAGQACWGGLDLSTKLDLTALVLAFPRPGKAVEFVCRFWLPEERVAFLERKQQRHWAQWAKDGWLATTPGEIIDYDFIEKEVVALSKRYSLQELGYDPHGATQISTSLAGKGVTMVETRQGYLTLSEPSKDFEARIIAAQVRHHGNPVMRYCVSNAVVTKDSAGNIKPDKAKASGRIDGVVAAVMALSRVIVSKPGDAGDYPDGGFKQL